MRIISWIPEMITRNCNRDTVPFKETRNSQRRNCYRANMKMFSHFVIKIKWLIGATQNCKVFPKPLIWITKKEMTKTLFFVIA